MANEKIANNIFNAMSILIDKSISKADFDKTYKAQVTEVIDASQGLYQVVYENAMYRAYVDNPEIVYSLGTDVYILIPSGEPNAAYKKILGVVKDSAQVDIENTISELQNYYKSSPSLKLNTTKTVVASAEQQKLKLEFVSTLDPLLSYLKVSSALKIDGTFTSKYEAPIENVVRPPKNFEYGIEIAFTLKSQEADKVILTEKTITFNSRQMTGTPYSYLAPVEQSIIIDFAEKGINVADITSINSVSFYCSPLTSGNFEVALSNFAIYCINYTKLNDTGNTAIIRYNDDDSLEALLLDRNGIEIIENLTYQWYVDTYTPDFSAIPDNAQSGKVYSGMEDAISYDSLFKCEIAVVKNEVPTATYETFAYYYKLTDYIRAIIEYQDGILKCTLENADTNQVYIYQWYRNGQKVEGATESEYKPAVTTDLTTYYQCVVTEKQDSTWQEYDDIAINAQGATFETIKMQYCFWETDTEAPTFEALEEGVVATPFNSWIEATETQQSILTTPGYYTWTRFVIIDTAGDTMLEPQCTGNIVENVILYSKQSNTAMPTFKINADNPKEVEIGDWSTTVLEPTTATPIVYSISGTKVNNGYSVKTTVVNGIEKPIWTEVVPTYKSIKGEQGAPGIAGTDGTYQRFWYCSTQDNTVPKFPSQEGAAPEPDAAGINSYLNPTKAWSANLTDLTQAYRYRWKADLIKKTVSLDTLWEEGNNTYEVITAYYRQYGLVFNGYPTFTPDNVIENPGSGSLLNNRWYIYESLPAGFYPTKSNSFIFSWHGIRIGIINGETYTYTYTPSGPVELYWVYDPNTQPGVRNEEYTKQYASAMELTQNGTKDVMKFTDNGELIIQASWLAIRDKTKEGSEYKLYASSEGDNVTVAGWEVGETELTGTSGGYSTILRKPNAANARVLECGLTTEPNFYIQNDGKLVSFGYVAETLRKTVELGDGRLYISHELPLGDNEEITCEAGEITLYTPSEPGISPEQKAKLNTYCLNASQTIEGKEITANMAWDTEHTWDKRFSKTVLPTGASETSAGQSGSGLFRTLSGNFDVSQCYVISNDQGGLSAELGTDKMLYSLADLAGRVEYILRVIHDNNLLPH